MRWTIWTSRGTPRQQCGIDAVEYVNQFFKDKAQDADYLGKMQAARDDNGVKSLLIMVDGEGQLGDPESRARAQAVENHFKWVEAAKTLGCHSIRVNAASDGTYEEQRHRAADGLRALTEFATPHEINVLVENHGGLSSNGQLAGRGHQAWSTCLAAARCPTLATSASATGMSTTATRASWS